MPYIESDKRPPIDKCIKELIEHIQLPGEINYAITSLIHGMIKRNGLCYGTLNMMVGVLECVKAELQRTVMDKYEDKKRKENGPVSELDE